MAFFEIINGFGKLLDFFHKIGILLVEEFVFLIQGLIIELDEVDVNANLLTLKNVLTFALKLFSQEVILLDKLLRVFFNLLTLFFHLLKFLLK